ncbi:hypothetical protein VTP01DRAFT_8389 [Rhizomucor pusillus]|uniref:uncharacterized protein n=1 Tax=Rhizomucor pusillus TaxID=4840 RepID=UPI0037441529
MAQEAGERRGNKDFFCALQNLQVGCLRQCLNAPSSRLLPPIVLQGLFDLPSMMLRAEILRIPPDEQQRSLTSRHPLYRRYDDYITQRSLTAPALNLTRPPNSLPPASLRPSSAYQMANALASVLSPPKLPMCSPASLSSPLHACPLLVTAWLTDFKALFNFPSLSSEEHVLDYTLNELPTIRRKMSSEGWRTTWMLVINILREIDHLSHSKSGAEFDQEPLAADALLTSLISTSPMSIL